MIAPVNERSCASCGVVYVGAAPLCSPCFERYRAARAARAAMSSWRRWGDECHHDLVHDPARWAA
jgi:hypothetical protein